MELDSSKEVTTKQAKGTIMSNTRWRLAVIILGLVSVGLLAALIASFLRNNDPDKCERPGNKYGNIDLSDSTNPSVFYHLTEKEINGLASFLYSRPELKLQHNKNGIDNNFIHFSDLHLPNKEEVLDYLDNNGPKPPREAKVIIIRGNETEPYVEEILVGPLPNPTSYKPVPYRSQRISYVYKPPFSGGEYYHVQTFLKESINNVLRTVLRDIYGGTLLNCNNKCLSFGFAIPVSPALSGEKKRKLWFTLEQKSEFSKHNPLDFCILVDINFKTFNIENVWFNGTLFSNLSEVLDFYNQHKESIVKVPFPSYSKDHFSTLHQRGTPPMDPPLRNPTQISPDGKRYNIQGRHVEYMFWKFDFRMSTLQGPHLYDIRFKNERIAYELSMQEIAVYYSGHKPSDALSNFLDSVGLIGIQSRTLFPGIDCPTDATIITSTFHIGGYSAYKPTSFCVFELNTGMPLRRHHSYWFSDGRFYEGMENIVLVLRTIPTIGIYDYIIDFMFYQNGAIEVKVTSTGYVKASFYTKEDDKYSYKLHDSLAATIHHHLFNFKVDLDIKGTSNRFASLDIEVEDIPNRFAKDTNARLLQNKFSTSTKQTESEAAYKFDFDSPKYLITYNEQSKDRHGNVNGYRILNKGMSKQMIPEGFGNEPSITWSRYQIAVTKYNDSERTSTSVFSTLDVNDQVVDFQKYIDDNDSIIDQDLVTWITMGHYHIPHTEDLPVTTSPGMDVNFFLLPYNYFEEDAAMASKNAVRVEPSSRLERGSSLNIQRYGVEQGIECVPEKTDHDKQFKENPRAIIDN